MIAKTSFKAYYAVIFTSLLSKEDTGYSEMSEKMIALARKQPGFLGIESARNEVGITVSYWQGLESIALWKQHMEHIEAQEKGKVSWYKAYKVRICKVIRDYDFEK